MSFELLKDRGYFKDHGVDVMAFDDSYPEGHPEIFSPELLYSSLNFILGTHPGRNTASFASGVGTKSVETAYGLNRADWSHIPGGGSSHYMFLVLAVRKLLREGQNS